MNDRKRNRLLNLRAAVSDWNPAVGIQFSAIQAVLVQLIDIMSAEKTGGDEDEFEEAIPADYEQRPYPLTYALTSKREIKLFRKLLKGTPVELTDASPETATMREILETEAVVEIDWKGEREVEYDLDGSVYWNGTKTVALIRWRT